MQLQFGGIVGAFLQHKFYRIILGVSFIQLMCYILKLLAEQNLGILTFITLPLSIALIGFSFVVLFTSVTEFDNDELYASLGCVTAALTVFPIYDLGWFGDSWVGGVILFLILYYAFSYLIQFILAFNAVEIGYTVFCLINCTYLFIIKSLYIFEAEFEGVSYSSSVQNIYLVLDYYLPGRYIYLLISMLPIPQ
jgi:hypothetical protein